MKASGIEIPKGELRWYGRKGLWVAAGLLVALSALWFDVWRQGATRTPGDGEPRATDPDTSATTHETDAPVVNAIGNSAIDSASDENGSKKERAEKPCKRAPIRGCAPHKDERGCYQCTRCWRPYHYDVDNSAKAISFVCQDMADGPLYVELADAAASPDTVQHWLVSVSFDGRRVEQLVSPNLGAAFFADFHGGNVELTAAMKACDRPSGPCRGDMDVTINARPGGAR